MANDQPDRQDDGLLSEHEFTNELGNRIYVALRDSDDDLVTIIIQTIRAKSDSSSENTVTRREALELAKVILKGLDRATPDSQAAAACSAVSKILCGEASCADVGNWRCPQNTETADEMIVEIVDAVFSLASSPVRGDREAIARALFDHWKTINPSWDFVEYKKWYRDHWLGFADAILSLSVQPGAGK